MADELIRRSGGPLVEQCISYTTDSKYLLCGSGTVIKLFSCATGALLRSLEGHTKRVTAVAHSTTNRLQAFSAGLDGFVILWDLDDAIILRCFCLGQPISSMACHASDPTKAYVITSSGGVPELTPAYAKEPAHQYRVYSQLHGRHSFAWLINACIYNDGYRHLLNNNLQKGFGL